MYAGEVLILQVGGFRASQSKMDMELTRQRDVEEKPGEYSLLRSCHECRFGGIDVFWSVLTGANFTLNCSRTREICLVPTTA